MLQRNLLVVFGVPGRAHGLTRRARPQSISNLSKLSPVLFYCDLFQELVDYINRLRYGKLILSVGHRVKFALNHFRLIVGFAISVKCTGNKAALSVAATT